MKVRSISVKNFKAVEGEQTATFDGCSAIITAGNGKGKSSLLKGLIDRFKGEKPEIILHSGEENGHNILELTDGSRIEWNFTTKRESFAYTTKEGIKQTSGVIKGIGERYFGQRFDIDKFLHSAPKQQQNMLADLVGLDFTYVDEQYKKAYEERTAANNELKRLQSMKLTKPEPVEKPDLDSLRQQQKEIREKNQKLKEQWQKDNERHLAEVEAFNKKQLQIEQDEDKADDAYNMIYNGLNTLEGLGFKKKNDILSELQEFTDALPSPEPQKEYKNLPEPEYYDESELEKRIEYAQHLLRQYDNYERDLKAYEDWVEQGKRAKEYADECDKKVKDIEAQKTQMIREANIPKEFEFTTDGILYEGFPLSENQIATSAKYIAALKLGSMALGELKTMHFDAGSLDKNNLAEIQKWAVENDLQLLIERPDFEGGEIKYQIV